MRIWNSCPRDLKKKPNLYADRRAGLVPGVPLRVGTLAQVARRPKSPDEGSSRYAEKRYACRAARRESVAQPKRSIVPAARTQPRKPSAGFEAKALLGIQHHRQRESRTTPIMWISPPAVHRLSPSRGTKLPGARCFTWLPTLVVSSRGRYTAANPEIQKALPRVRRVRPERSPRILHHASSGDRRQPG